MSNNQSFLARLEDVHEFPCAFVVKVIGANNEQFVADVLEVSSDVLTSHEDTEVQRRESSGGNHLSLTLTISASGAEEIVVFYERLNTVEGVKFLL